MLGIQSEGPLLSISSLVWWCGVCTQSCPILCDPIDCSLPGSSVFGISQARILGWVAFPPPGDLPNPGIGPVSPALADRFFTTTSPGRPNVARYLHEKAAYVKWYKKNNCCYSLRSHHSLEAVGVRERFHEKDQGSLMLRKEKYQDEQKGGWDLIDCSRGAACPKGCAWSPEK